MRKIFLVAFAVFFIAGAGNFEAEAKPYKKAMVSYEDFKHLVIEAEQHRKERLIDFDQFLKMSKEPNTIILDPRSPIRFDNMHLKGAKNLSFTMFMQETLAAIIPDSETRILIYCDNNFEGQFEKSGERPPMKI